MAADHDRMEEAVAAYALDACDDDDERERVRAHVAGCPGCRALLERLAPAVEALPLAADEVRPPDLLRARILAAAAAQRQAPAGRDEPAPRIVPLPVRGGRPVAGRGRRRAVAAGAAAVAACALVALAGWNVALQRQLDAAPARFDMAGTGTLAGASGTVTVSRGQGVVSLTGLPPLPPGRVYELWLIDAAGTATPGAVFAPTPAGTASVGLDRPLDSVRAVAVTQETGPGGARSPTRKPELAGQLGG